jgi:hypothetical protein
VRNKPTLNEKNQEENVNENPFDRETPFRQSISEKRRLTQQPSNQSVQWKQQSFHESRTNSERRKFKIKTILLTKFLSIKSFVELKQLVNIFSLLSTI